jgi:hypothetical protein
VNRWTTLADAIATALETKDPDEGIYGKRDWALVAVLEALRDAAIQEAESVNYHRNTEQAIGELVIRAASQVALEGRGTSRAAKRRRAARPTTSSEGSET